MMLGNKCTAPIYLCDCTHIHMYMYCFHKDFFTLIHIVSELTIE